MIPVKFPALIRLFVPAWAGSSPRGPRRASCAPVHPRVSAPCEGSQDAPFPLSRRALVVRGRLRTVAVAPSSLPGVPPRAPREFDSLPGLLRDSVAPSPKRAGHFRPLSASPLSSSGRHRLSLVFSPSSRVHSRLRLLLPSAPPPFDGACTRQGTQTSQGLRNGVALKARDLRSIYRSHLHSSGPDDHRVWVSLPPRPPVECLVCFLYPPARAWPAASFPPRLAAVAVAV